MEKKLIKFLKSECPITVLEERVTWGYFIGLNIQGAIGAVGFFTFYLMFVILADILQG